MYRLGLSVAALLVLAAGNVGGQAIRSVADGSLDVGGALLSQPGLAATNVVTAAGQFRYATTKYALTGSGVGARTPEDRYTGQGVFTASRYAPPGRRSRWELAATTSAFGLSGAGPAFSWQALARQHLTSSLGGVFVGVAGGEVVQSDRTRKIGNAHAGGFLRLDPLGRDELSMAVSYTDAGRLADSLAGIRYADAIGYWTRRVYGMDLSAGAGARVRALRGRGAEGWASGSATVWITERAAVVLAAGRALEDPSRGVPSVRYLSAALRIGASRGGVLPSLHVRRDHLDEDGGRLDIRAADDSTRVLVVRLATADSLDLMADFTDWEPVPMAKQPNGEWRLERVIAPGPHRVAIRANGGKWIVPSNLPRVTDDFGGDVGLITVP